MLLEQRSKANMQIVTEHSLVIISRLFINIISSNGQLTLRRQVDEQKSETLLLTTNRKRQCQTLIKMVHIWRV